MNELAIAECRKAFSVFDGDGNGSVDVGELRNLMTALFGEPPNDAELAAFLAHVDTDQSGTVEFNEFQLAMEKWMSTDFRENELRQSSEGVVGRKRRASSGDDRDAVHKKIRSFFTQFKQNVSQLELIRANMEASGTRSEAEGGGLEDGGDMSDASPFAGEAPVAYTAEKKLQCLSDFRAALKSVPSMCATLSGLHATALTTFTAQKLYEVVKWFSDLLSIVEVFPTPLERRAVASDVASLFELCASAGLPAVWARALGHDLLPALQSEAARAIALFAPGPRIASTPVESLLHPSRMLFKRLVIAEGCVPVLLRLIAGSAVAEVREQSMLAVGALAAHDWKCRDFLLLQHNALAPVLATVTQTAPISTVRKAMWTTAVLCGVTHRMDRLPPWHAVAPSLQTQCLVLFCDDPPAIATVCRCLAILLPGNIELSVCRRLTFLLGHADPLVVAAVLQTLAAVVMLDNEQMWVLLNQCSLVARLRTCLQSADSGVRLRAVRILCILAGAKGQIDALLTGSGGGDALELSVKMVQSDELTRYAAVKVLKYAARGTPLQVRALVDLDAVPVLCGALAHFRVYDAVIIRAYNYAGPTFNFAFVRDALDALDNVINVGELEAEESGQINPYARLIDVEAVNKIRAVCQAIRDGEVEGLEAWRRRGLHDTTVEERMRVLLLKVQRNHDLLAARGETASALASQMIAAVFHDFFAHMPEPEATRSVVLLKCFLAGGSDDVRVVEVPVDVAYEALAAGLAQKYGLPGVVLSFRDPDGDSVRIDSQSALSMAISQFVAAGSSAGATLKLWVAAGPPPTDHAAAAAGALPDSLSASAGGGSGLAVPPSLLSPVALRRREPEAGGAAPAAGGSAHASTADADDWANKPEFSSSALQLTAPSNEAMQRAELAALVDASAFNQEEIGQLSAVWAKQCDSQGRLDREQFAAGLKSLGVDDPLLIDQNFRWFDRDGSGFIDFKEFLVGLSVLQRGSLDDKLQLLFESYDSDRSGFLEFAEVQAIFQASLANSLTAQAPSSPEERLEYVRRLVRECFAAADANKDGKLSLAEFKQAVTQNQLAVNSLIRFPDVLV